MIILQSVRDTYNTGIDPAKYVFKNGLVKISTQNPGLSLPFLQMLSNLKT